MLLWVLLLVPTIVVGMKATAVAGPPSNGQQRSWVQIPRRCVLCVSIYDVIYHPPWLNFQFSKIDLISPNNKSACPKTIYRLLQHQHECTDCCIPI